MPKRTNEFQQFVTYVYQSVAPIGATVAESAMLREGGDGAEREVDILISHKIADLEIHIAIECRNWTKDQDIGWLDGLVGKYKRLAVNKIIAVSSTPFSPAAHEKAEEERIELLTVLEAKQVDWASRLAAETFGIGRHANFLMNVLAVASDGSEVTSTTTDGEGNVTHKDELSAALFPHFKAYYDARHKLRVDADLFEIIRKNMTTYFRNPTPRYCELTVETPGAIYVSEMEPNIPLSKIVFGVGTIITVSNSPVTNKVLKNFMISEFNTGHIGDHDYKVRFITAKEGGVIRLDVRQG